MGIIDLSCIIYGNNGSDFNIPEDALKPKIRVFSYDQTSVEEKEITDAHALKSIIESTPGKTHWIDIRGFGDKKFFEKSFQDHEQGQAELCTRHGVILVYLGYELRSPYNGACYKLGKE